MNELGLPSPDVRALAISVGPAPTSLTACISNSYLVYALSAGSTSCRSVASCLSTSVQLYETPLLPPSPDDDSEDEADWGDVSLQPIL